MRRKKDYERKEGKKRRKEGGKEGGLDEGLYSMSDVLWRKLRQGVGRLEDVLRCFSSKLLMNYVQANIKVKVHIVFDHFL